MYNEYSLDRHAILMVSHDQETNNINMLIACKKTGDVLNICGCVHAKTYCPFDGDIQYMLDCMDKYTDRCDMVYPELLQQLCQFSDEQLCDVEFMKKKVKNMVRNKVRRLEREINNLVKMQLDDNAELTIEPFVE